MLDCSVFADCAGVEKVESEKRKDKSDVKKLLLSPGLFQTIFTKIHFTRLHLQVFKRTIDDRTIYTEKNNELMELDWKSFFEEIGPEKMFQIIHENVVQCNRA